MGDRSGRNRRRQARRVARSMAFAVTHSAVGEADSVTVFSGRRALTRSLRPGEAAALAALLTSTHRGGL